METKPSLEQLTKKAVKAALGKDWKAAIKLNTQILELDKDDTKAKMRLGNAYLNTKKFINAEKFFKQVLKADPINRVAEKNLKLAKEKKIKNNGDHDLSELIHRPGTTMDVTLHIEHKTYSAEDLEKGEKLQLKANKASTNVYRMVKNKEVLVGKILSKAAEQICKAKKKGAKLIGIYQSGKDKNIKMIIKADSAVFKAKKQEIRPYSKKIIDEPKLELPDADL